jgi:hypothetical protein
MSAVAACPAAEELDVSVMLMNLNGSRLVSGPLAEHIALAFFQDRYSPTGTFEAKLPAELQDLGDRWSVRFQNVRFDPSIDPRTQVQIKALGVEICKSNGAILRIK